MEQAQRMPWRILLLAEAFLCIMYVVVDWANAVPELHSPVGWPGVIRFLFVVLLFVALVVVLTYLCRSVVSLFRRPQERRPLHYLAVLFGVILLVPGGFGLLFFMRIVIWGFPSQG